MPNKSCKTTTLTKNKNLRRSYKPSKFLDIWRYFSGSCSATVSYFSNYPHVTTCPTNSEEAINKNIVSACNIKSCLMLGFREVTRNAEGHSSCVTIIMSRCFRPVCLISSCWLIIILKTMHGRRVATNCF